MKKPAIVAASKLILAKVERPTADEIKQFRENLGLTQEEFAREFEIPLVTIRRWEQKLNTPRRRNPIYTMWRAVARSQRTHRNIPKTTTVGEDDKKDLGAAALLSLGSQHWLGLHAHHTGSSLLAFLGS